MKNRHLSYLFFVIVLIINTFSCEIIAQTSIDYDPGSGKFRLLNPPRLQEFASAKDKKVPSERQAKWGVYLWEFGDGHYAIGDKGFAPTHFYTQAGRYTVRIYLTPFYAVSRDTMFSREITVSAKSNTKRAYTFGKTLVNIETNTGDYIVPGHRIQTILNYKAAQVSAGHLLFFYNHKRQLGGKTRFDHFQIVEDRLYGSEIRQANVLNVIENKLWGEARKEAARLSNDYRRSAAYYVPELKADESRRLFISLLANQEISKHLSKKEQLTFDILWIPDAGNFEPTLHKATQYLTILPVYDPNRIRVSPKMSYYNPNFHKKLRYRVDFQNEAEGIVTHVTVAIALEKNLNVKEVEIGSMSPRCDKCPPNPPVDSVCYEIKKLDYPDQDSLLIVFRNVGLIGKENLGWLQSKASTKGSVTFDIMTNAQKIANTDTRAYIFFEGAPEVLTRKATTTWRQRGFYVGLGYTPFLESEGFETVIDEWWQKANLSLGVTDMPVGNGFSWGIEAAFTNHLLSRENTMETDDTPILPSGGLVTYKEITDIKYLNLSANAGFQLAGYARAYAGVGTSLPILAELELRSEHFPISGAASTNFRNVSQFGMLQKQTQARMFNQPIAVNMSPGLYMRWGVEAGLLDRISLALGGEMQRFEKFYHGECAMITSWQASLRFRLFRMGGRWE